MSGQRSWAVVGAGAMGSVIGGHLALAGHPVTLVDVRRDHIDAIRAHGLEMRRPDGAPSTVEVAATTDPAEDLSPVDVLLFMCKSFATVDAARSVAHALAPGGVAVTLQNGLGNDRRLAEVFDVDRVVPGTTTVGAESVAPGVVLMAPATAAGRSMTEMGPPRTVVDGVPDVVVDVAADLVAAGLPARALPSADGVIWSKVAMAASMGCLTAALRRTVADVIGDPHAWSLWTDMFEEVVAVAAAAGVELDVEALRAHCVDTYTSVGPHVTSMAADVVAGRRTEVDALALGVAEEGRRVGVPTPVTETVGRIIASLEATYDRTL
ncbi:ketopantoate reductase family protein [Euzebya rosea]|uniref:ketopantoate reductase family protein n=1 Tax=Euzebya rosea TaxID=2052804 RepID=UPI000D3E1468|nr:2-dehydropantoate 2-reductase [Euzebya rosea]